LANMQDFLKKLKERNINEIGSNPDYIKFLNAQEYLKSLNGKQILEMAEYYEEIYNGDDINNSFICRELKNSYKNLKEKNEKLNEENFKLKINLKSKLEKIIEPIRK